MLKAIKNSRDHKKAVTRIYELMHRNIAEGSDEYNELEVLSILVDDYESRRFQVLPPDPIEAIKFRMEQLEIDANGLSKFLGSRSRVSEILNRKRKLSLAMIRTLSEKLNIPAESLIRRY